MITNRYTSFTFTLDVDYWGLFDRDKDPRELKSVYGDPAYAAVQADLMDAVQRLRKQ